MRVLPWLASAIGFTVIGVVGTLLVVRLTSAPPGPMVGPTPTTTSGPPAPVPVDAGDTELLIPPDVVTRAGLKTATVGAADVGVAITIPGTVMPNAYHEVKVTPIAGGILTKIHVDLGASVQRGAPLATIFSSELADAQTRYLSMRAMLEADHKKLERTERLVAIGAASRQELEEVTAVHVGHETEAASARQRLLLLGLSQQEVDGLSDPSKVVSQVVVPAPIGGVVTTRSANPGQVVAMGQELFVVTDLGTVWLVGDLYEQDFAAVRVGSEATITTAAYPGSELRGRVSYIDPRVDSQTRTAKIRVEVPNLGGRLRLGMYVSMFVPGAGGQQQVVVPRAAVQTMGDRSVVFLPVAGEEGKFLRRKVRVGIASGDFYIVLEGLRIGDIVVTDGSFLLRAEAARSGS